MSSIRVLSRPPVSFPPAWAWLMDEIVPEWVKRTYSPRESWKDKPFSREDARFFFRGIEELSELFTEERRKMPSYFDHPKFRSAYLLYFLPLQAAKFVSLFKEHPEALDAALRHARRAGALRIADIGAGPGTASLAFLLVLLETAKGEVPPIELHWVDTNRSILGDGKALAETLSSHFPKLRDKVSVHLSPVAHSGGRGWELPKGAQEFSLILLGHVFNESPGKDWRALLARSSGAGTLIVEPASRSTSQALSKLRDELLLSGSVAPEPASFWGPCPHAQACPLAAGRDYCHFSVRAQVPGKWFLEFSKGLGSERQWLKYSYLWIAASEAEFRPSRKPDPRTKLVISDPLGGSREGPSEVLLCEPERPGRIKLPSRLRAYRGDVLIENTR